MHLKESTDRWHAGCEEFNKACSTYEELLEETHDKDEAYQWYDI